MGGSHYCCCIFAISVQVLLLLPLTHAASCTVTHVHAMRSAHTRQCHYSNVPWYRYSEYWHLKMIELSRMWRFAALRLR